MKYFRIEEFTSSATAARLNISNVPSEEELNNINRLVDEVLDPIREAWGAPIVVNSGYRCPALNRAVGGSTTSHHMTGCAADITVLAYDISDKVSRNKQLFSLIQKLDVPFTQLIDEKNYAWLHISYDPSRTRQRQILHL